jgi:protocatechuate 3,4-dioxygenase beta subunit
VNTCEPIENVLLDIWHCDALGESHNRFDARLP